MATTSSTTHAVILAAGKGSRLDPDEQHKLLVEIGGRPMIERHLRNFATLGVTDVTVVTGWEHAALEEALADVEPPEGMRLHTALNPGFEGSLGLSVLVGADQARCNPDVDRPVPFWLTMSDHLYEPGLFEELAAEFEDERPAEAEGMLVVDTDIDAIFDLPDATKLRLDDEGRLEDVGKRIDPFNAADTGLFWCAEGFVEALEAERREHGDGFTTAEAVLALEDAGQMWFWEVGEYRWQDVDTPEARAHAAQVSHLW